MTAPRVTRADLERLGVTRADLRHVWRPDRGTSRASSAVVTPDETRVALWTAGVAVLVLGVLAGVAVGGGL